MAAGGGLMVNFGQTKTFKFKCFVLHTRFPNAEMNLTDMLLLATYAKYATKSYYSFLECPDILRVAIAS